nr:hypothetical protein [Candidatus Sigynarchaeota archaeon]
MSCWSELIFGVRDPTFVPTRDQLHLVVKALSDLSIVTRATQSEMDRKIDSFEYGTDGKPAFADDGDNDFSLEYPLAKEFSYFSYCSVDQRYWAVRRKDPVKWTRQKMDIFPPIIEFPFIIASHEFHYTIPFVITEGQKWIDDMDAEMRDHAVLKALRKRLSRELGVTVETCHTYR